MGGVRAWRSRWSVLAVGVRDGLLAAVLVAVVQLELLAARDDVEGSFVLQQLAFAVMVGAVALRRRRPLVMAVVAGTALGLQTLLGPAPVGAAYVALFVAVYSVATYARCRRDALLGLGAVLAGIAVYPFTVEDVKLADEVVNAMIPTVVWVLALVARERQERAVAAERTRLEQELEAGRRRQEAIDEERRRIAREVHDTVAHGVTLMLLQSELLRDGPGDSAVLDVVQGAGRSCLDDLRRLLVVLRADGDARPLPGGIAQLPVLVDSARAAGVTVRLHAPVTTADLPPALDAVVFRVVQEALTNAVRYASGGTVDVRWAVSVGHVQVDVDDDGPRGGRVVESGSGHGLTGLRERVELEGGTLVAGPRADGDGWRVHASLPLSVAVAAS